MNRFAVLFAAGCAFGAHASTSVNAADLPHISNGGTGYIGLTASAATDRMASMAVAAPGAPTTPAMSWQASAVQSSLRTLGNAPAATDPRTHRAWGTPD